MTSKKFLFLACIAGAALVSGCKEQAKDAAASATEAATAAAAPLTAAGSVDFPGYTGDFDHFAIDTKDNRLFLTGEEFHEVEVLDRLTGKIIKRLPGFGVPHSLFYMPEKNEMLVIDGEKPSAVLDAATLEVKRTLPLAKGADSIGFDKATGHLWVVTGGKDVPQPDSYLNEIDPATGKVLKSIHFDSNHVEAMAVQQNGPNLFINVTDKNYLAVVDKASGKVVKTWPIKEAQENAPLAMDEVGHRLFVVTRKPGKLVVLNSDTGESLATFTAPERTDQVVWDAANRRVYATGGEGYTLVVEQDDPDHYREVAKVQTAPGAKTSILDSENNRFWIAASPGETGAMGKLLWFDVAPR